MADDGLVIVTDRDGTQKYRLNVVLEWAYPFDPNSPMLLMWAPPGGVGQANLPFMLKGDSGLNAAIQGVDFTPLAPTDPTPDTVQLVELRPASSPLGQLSKFVVALHTGQDGADGTSTLDPTDYGTVVAGRILVVKDDLSGFQYAAQKVGGMHWPTALTEAPSATTANYTVASITVPANTYPYPYYRPSFTGESLISSTIADTAVDLVVHLGTTGGAVLGRCTGLPGLTDRLIVASGPDAGAGDTVNKIDSTVTTTFLLCTEKQGGTGTYASGVIAPTRFNMVAVPVA